jgi:UDPglucose 6-dehydrogenase
MQRASEVLGDRNIRYMRSPEEAAAGADALLVLTDWPEFAQLDLKRIRSLLRYPIVVDGRNLFNQEAMRSHDLLMSV